MQYEKRCYFSVRSKAYMRIVSMLDVALLQGHLNQWAHWARARGPGFFFLFEGPQLAVK